MNLKLWLIITIVLILALAGALIYVLSSPSPINNKDTTAPNNTITNNTASEPNSCLALNCSSSAKYVGSVNSDKYYVCDCRYAKNINPENIVCFSSDAEALSKDYTKIQC